MIELKNITLQRGLKVLLDNASLTIHPNQRVGLIGKNGTGKSSLFSLLKGDIHPETGDILIPKHWKMASVSQETPSLPISAIAYVLQGDAQLSKLQAALSQAESDNDGEAIAKIHAELSEIDAYTAPSRAAKLLSGLGFSQDEHQKAVSAFSGGWRMRLNLAQALMCRADLLLLDEPTNHLDIETVLWLENYLSSLAATQLIISHDKDFLNATTNRTVELNQQKLHLYGGNYDFFEEERALRLSQQQAAYTKQQNHIKHLQSFIDRFKAKATKATQAQSRMKALAKLERLAPAHLDSDFSFEFSTPDTLPNTLLKLDGITLGYGDNTIIKDIQFNIESGARLGLLGVNGSGKSTLIKAISGSLKPKCGQIIRADKLKIGYFAQHQLESLRADQSPIWHIQQISPEVREQEIRNFLGGFNFVGDMAMQEIAPFSGGEKARLALAMLVWQKPNLLLLDEPTNHLDLDLRHALTLSLQSFEGAMLLVSHDRSLLEATTDQFWLIYDGKLQQFDGDLNDYRQWRLNQEQAAQEPSASSTSQNRKDIKRQEAQIRQALANKTRPLQKQIDAAEQNMQQLSVQQDKINAFLAEESAYDVENKAMLQENLNQLAQIKTQLAQIEEDWLMWQETLENIKEEILQQFNE